MASIRTAGITTGTNGRRFIDKRYRGIRIGMRVGAITQEQAEQRLRTEIQRVDLEVAERAHARPLFRDCAARYLTQARDKRSLEAIRVHVRLLMMHIGSLELSKRPQVRRADVPLVDVEAVMFETGRASPTGISDAQATAISADSSGATFDEMNYASAGTSFGRGSAGARRMNSRPGWLPRQ